MFDFPWLIIRFENKVLRGMNAPPIQSNCIKGMLPVHFPPTVIRISSCVTMLSPNIAGKARKAQKRRILRNTRRERSRSSLMRAVPFVRLIVVAHGLRIEILSQYHRKQVVVQLVGDVRYQEFATEGKKRLQRTEVDAERGSPRREIPRAERHRNQVSKALCGDAPIGEAAKGERDAQAARNHVGNDTRKGLLAHLQVAR